MPEWLKGPDSNRAKLELAKLLMTDGQTGNQESFGARRFESCSNRTGYGVTVACGSVKPLVGVQVSLSRSE